MSDVVKQIHTQCPLSDTAVQSLALMILLSDTCDTFLWAVRALSLSSKLALSA